METSRKCLRNSQSRHGPINTHDIARAKANIGTSPIKQLAYFVHGSSLLGVHDLSKIRPTILGQKINTTLINLRVTVDNKEDVKLNVTHTQPSIAATLHNLAIEETSTEVRRRKRWRAYHVFNGALLTRRARVADVWSRPVSSPPAWLAPSMVPVSREI
eukprot:1745391-Pleurochrysis_carterae.AAC.1